jgi:hypothetical protein
MLLSAVMDRPSYVWDETKEWLADGVLYKQRKIANNRGMTYYTSFTILSFLLSF